jgi:DNA topoisomerase IA
MTKQDILSSLNSIIHLRLCSAIKKMHVENKKDKFVKSSEYQNLDSKERYEILNQKYTVWYKSVESFYLSLYSIYSLIHLVKREKEIIEFRSQEMTVVMVDYFEHNNIEFSASYPTRFTADMKKEIEDCVEELQDPKFEHIVTNYKPEKDAERPPHEPLTNKSLKYSCSYLFQFDYKYTTQLATLLYEAGLITNINTSGWHIDDDFVEEIITLLNAKYKEYQVLQRKRVFQDNNRDRSEECIRPINLSATFFPKNIQNSIEFNTIAFENGRVREDAIKLYGFIFYITLSTQMNDSKYDTSSVEIQVGPKKLKQKANILIQGQDNWELLSGKYIRTIQENDSSEYNQSKTIILPEFKHDDKLEFKQVYPYTYNSRRPRRYGIGRFAAQILEKCNIGNSLDHDDIINNLIQSKAVIQIQQVLNPQEISIFLIDWLKEFAPLLVDFEYLNELNEKVNSILEGDLSLESLENEIHRILDDAFVKAGYVEDNSKPSPAKINLLHSVAAKYNVNLPNEVFESNLKCDMLLAMYPMAKPIKVGSCPNCNAVVYQKEYIDKKNQQILAYFACEKFSKTNGCTFSIWDNKVEKFFSDRGINFFTVEERKDALKKILPKKRGYLFSNLIDESKKTYNAKVAIKSFIPKENNPDKKTVWFLKVMKKEEKR